ncbi:MAG: two-component system histidine kinase PnpS [Peptococcia bacterium]|jgi:two-component system phosphate regulon sensor histidine kinase PhoR
MRKKIIIYYLILTITAVSIMAFFMWRAAYNLYQDELEEKLVYSAKLIGQELLAKSRNKGAVDYDEAAHKYAQILTADQNNKTRITFIDYEGNVLGESEADYRLMGNHRNRKEVWEAIEKGRGMDIRSSGTLKSKYLYVALSYPETGIVTRVSVPMVQLAFLHQKILGSSLLAFLIGLLITVVLVWRFSDQLLKPINALKLAFNKVAQGDYTARVRYLENDEFRDLADGFNRMTVKLENTVADLQRKKAQVELILNNMVNGIIAVDQNMRIILLNSLACDLFGLESVTSTQGAYFIEKVRNNEINTMIKETSAHGFPLSKEINMGFSDEKIYRVYSSPINSMGSTNTKLGVIISIHDITKIKKLEQIRTEFISNVTHELKTPLTSIRGFIETLRNGAINKPEVAEDFLKIIDLEAERLYILINDILQLSEIETMPQDVQIDAYRLKLIVDEVLAIFSETASKKKLTITTEIAADLVITANRNRIKQMFINLLDNAIKYNVEEGSIKIKAWQTADKLLMTIKDDGIGIGKEHLDRIFERFYRVDKGRSRALGGTGLGLSIVKHIVNLYKGTIEVNSEPGRGTEFIISWPVAERLPSCEEFNNV